MTSNTRRNFIQTATLAAGVGGGHLSAFGQAPLQPPGGPQAAKAGNRAAISAAELQVPKMKFGGVEISRLVAGCNPFYGFAHFNNTLGAVMRDYYTPERICDVLHQCNRFGINAHNYVNIGRAPQDLARFQSEGGKMHLIVQGFGDPAPLVRNLKPLAVYHHGEFTDRAFQNGEMDTVREWCKKVRDLGVLVGVGSHNPEVLAQVEEQAWDVDFYAGCVYNRSRTAEEWKEVLHGETLEMQGETYLKSDPPKMYKFMRQTRKPCFAFKIMAAGRVSDKDADHAFELAYSSIKPTDGVFIGLFPRVKDEVRENVERVHRILTRS